MNLTLIEQTLASNNDSPETFSKAEPVSVADMQTHARLPATLTLPADDPDYIETLIAAAREQVEEYECRIQLLTAVYELRLDWGWPYDPIKLPKPPLQEVLSVKYIDTDGVEQTIYDTTVSPAVDDGLLVIDAKSSHSTASLAEIYRAYNQTLPSVRCERNAVRIRYRCGFGDTAISVPNAIRQWIMIMAATMYEHRELEIIESVNQLKYVSGLLDPWRAPRIVS